MDKQLENISELQQKSYELGDKLLENESFEKMFKVPEATLNNITAFVMESPVDDNGELMLDDVAIKNMHRAIEGMDDPISIDDHEAIGRAFETIYDDLKMKALQNNPELTSDIDGVDHKLAMAEIMLEHSDYYRMNGAENTGFSNDEYSKNLKELKENGGLETIKEIIEVEGQLLEQERGREEDHSLAS